MKKLFRILMAVAVFAGILFLAGNPVAWAGQADNSPQVSDANLQGVDALGKPEPGSVKPPPADVTACGDGIHSVGGVATLTITNLADGYCITAFLRNHAFALGRIPDGAGKVLAHITFLRVFYHGRLVYELPLTDGKVEICYAIPPDKTAQMYFFDFYGPRLDQRSGKPDWQPLDTTVNDSAGCTSAQITGAYALIGK